MFFNKNHAKLLQKYVYINNSHKDNSLSSRDVTDGAELIMVFSTQTIR